MILIIFSIILLITIEVLLLMKVYEVFSKAKSYKNKYILERDKMELSVNFDENTFAMLDTFISREFYDLLALHPGYMESDYIDSKLREKIMRELLDRIARNISPTIVKKISVIYKEDSLYSIISEKTYMIILQWSLQINKKYNNDNSKDKKENGKA